MKRALILLILLLAAGCASPPHRGMPRSVLAERPEIGGPFLGQNGAVTTAEDLPAHWWSLYGDARLDSYVEQALAANTDLRAADANLRRASAIVRESQAARSPQTGASGQVLGARAAGPTGGLPGDFSYSLGFDVGYPLDLDHGLRLGVEATAAEAEAAEAARDQVRVTVAAAVTRNYARICTANMSLATARRVAALRQSTLQVASRMAQSGRGTRFDVERARAAAFASEAQIPDILAERHAALLTLTALMGRPPADYPRDAQNCHTMPRLSRPIPVGDGARLIRRRPDIRRAERTLAAATAAIGIAQADLYPRITLNGSAGSAGRLTDLLNPASFGFGLGPVVTWNFPNRKAAHARIEQADAGAQAALAGFDGSVLFALQQTESSLSAYARAQQALKSLEVAAEAAGRAAADAETLQQFGRTPFLDVLNAQASDADAQSSLSKARTTLIDRQIDLFLSLGGGWE